MTKAKPLPEKLTAEEESRFWSRVDKGERDDCWRWIGSAWKRGYGFIQIRGVKYRATRISVLLSRGEPVPTDMLVCHKCDNPPCVNPAHLFLGTMSDNIRDAVKKGRLDPKVMRRNWVTPPPKTRCKNGHAMRDGNVIHKTNGQRVCRICQHASDARWRAKVKRARNALSQTGANHDAG